jgi:hypothetical protein
MSTQRSSLAQAYNAVLTLAHLSAASDGILVMENDAARHACAVLLRGERARLGCRVPGKHHSLTLCCTCWLRSAESILR